MEAVRPILPHQQREAKPREIVAQFQIHLIRSVNKPSPTFATGRIVVGWLDGETGWPRTDDDHHFDFRLFILFFGTY